MSAVPDTYWRDCDIVQSASSDQIRKFLLEVAVFLNRVVPYEEIERLLEEISDHFETMLEAGDQNFDQIALEFGSSRDLADNFIRAWYTKRASPSIIEKRMGTGAMFVFGTFGIATLAYWILLQSRVCFCQLIHRFACRGVQARFERSFLSRCPFPTSRFNFC